jgi:hypothetical protein
MMEANLTNGNFWMAQQHFPIAKIGIATQEQVVC